MRKSGWAYAIYGKREHYYDDVMWQTDERRFDTGLIQKETRLMGRMLCSGARKELTTDLYSTPGPGACTNCLRKLAKREKCHS